MLFQDLSEAGIRLDLAIIYSLVDGFFAQYPNVTSSLDTNATTGIMYGMRQDFPYREGIQMASPFKKAANFCCYWTAAKPILMNPEPLSNVNAYFALMIALRSLHGARLDGHDGGDARTLTNRIELSKHSLVDITEALSTATPGQSFKLVSVLFEQMAYKTNSICQYPNVLDVDP